MEAADRRAGWLAGWLAEWMDGRIDAPQDGWLDGWTSSEWLSFLTEELICRQLIQMCDDPVDKHMQYMVRRCDEEDFFFLTSKQAVRVCACMCVCVCVCV